jgi:hypothetical protein
MRTKILRPMLVLLPALAFTACGALIGIEESSATLESADATTPSPDGAVPPAEASAPVADGAPGDAAPPSGDGGPGCVPKAAAVACGANKCGNAPDGCNGTVSCGACAPTEDCVFSNNTFACKLRAPNCSSCTDLAKNCGTVANNCGQNLDCGLCKLPNSCGGGGAANVCGCTKTPQANACAGKCGAVADGCGGTWDCGGCTAPSTCGGAGIANVCGCSPTPLAVACVGKACQAAPDNCGKNYACPATGTKVCFNGVECAPAKCGTVCGFVDQGCGLGEIPCDGTCPVGRICDFYTATRNRCVIGDLQ